jgi:hypothetical protein
LLSFKKGKFIILSLVLVMVLCFGFYGSVLASSPVAYTGQTSQGNYTISTAAQLAELAAKVNAQQSTDYLGSIFTLTNSIDLAISDTFGNLSWTGGTNWTPIGGACPISNGVPIGKHFAGVFDGNGFQIKDIKIQNAISGYGAYGLFGFINGGAVLNLETDGNISIATPVISVGGIVGYIYGSIDNCHNSVKINLTDLSTTTSMCGGIAGCIENNTGTEIKLQHCSNSAEICGRGRVGGIAGAVYCTSAGGVKISQCFNEGNIKTTSNRNAHSAGIVGYCRGHIDSCYNKGEIEAINFGHYIAGIVGLLQDSSPQAQLKNCFNTGVVIDAGVGYCQALFATTGNSTTMPITNCFWLDTLSVGQSTGTGWGNCVNVAAVTEAQLNGNAPYSGNYYVLDYLNNFDDSEEIYSQVPGEFPVLTWEVTGHMATSSGYTPGSVGSDSDDPSMIFVDGTALTNGNGTKINPFNNMASALAAADIDRDIIYINGQVTLNSDAGTWSGTAQCSNPIIKRSCTYSGYLVEVGEGGSLSLEDITIDGNWYADDDTGGIVTTCNSLFNVTRDTYNGTPGSLTIGPGAVLQNSFANSGAAVRIYGAEATLDGGTIIDNNALTNGGAVAVYRWVPGGSSSRDDFSVQLQQGQKEFRPGNFILNSGTISGNNAANYGGAVYLGMSQNLISIDGGIIGGSNPAEANHAVFGGGVYLERNACFSMTDGVIKGNSATTGPGIYLNSDGSLVPSFTVSPSSSSFDIEDVIYLNDDAYITIPATVANITGLLTVVCPNPVSNGTIVAKRGGSYFFVPSDCAKFAWGGMGNWIFDITEFNTQIKLQQNLYKKHAR